MRNKNSFLIILIILTLQFNALQSYIIGVGRADCTGPPVEVTFMGYAEMKQNGHGIHLRQFARTFIVEDEQNHNRIVFVSVDAGMMGHGIKRDVVDRLRYKYGNIYRMDNVIISGTHTHSAPGGFLEYLLYDLPSLGFVKDTSVALVNGIFTSISRAHLNMRQGRIFLSETEVLEANINRSPTAYLQNPKKDRTNYSQNVDKQLVQLRLEDIDGQILGAFNWFAVHPVSMNNTNKFVSTDNVGYASILLEKQQNPDDLVGKGFFVGAFASTNLGDVSPNIKGPKCQLSGNRCNEATSKCKHDEGYCIASGPGQDMFESTKIIATRIYKAASNLLQKREGKEIKGPVQFILQNINMTTQKGQFHDPGTNTIQNYKGCLPAVGYSFAAGTTDGPGSFMFEQSTTTDNELWNLVRDFVAEPTEEDKLCHAPKPILIMTGRAKSPYEWTPKVVPTQIVRIGEVLIAAVPGEFTTMSGRRLRAVIKEVARQEDGENFDVIIAGLSNLYTSYIVTPEEYQAQRYEGASTLYGPHTLTIYLQQFGKLTTEILREHSLDIGPIEPNFRDKQMSLTPPVFYDSAPKDLHYGYVLEQPKQNYKRGERITVSFISGNPRNNLMHERSYFTVEQKQSNDMWKVKLTDADWDTKFIWERTNMIMGTSKIIFFWDIANDAEPGLYRIRHFGFHSYILGGKFPYIGNTTTFIVQ